LFCIGKMSGLQISNFGLKIYCVCIIIFILPLVHGMKCEFCAKDFTCLARHSWRCRAKITSSMPPVDTHAPCDQQSSNRNENNSLNYVVSNSSVNESVTVVYISCVCGRKFKGRKGLIIHQRTCRINSALKTECNNMCAAQTDDANEPVDPEQGDHH